MKSITHLSFPTLLVLSSMFFSASMALVPRSKSHFPETSSACHSNLFRSNIQTIPPTCKRASRPLFSAASIESPVNARDVQTKLPGIWWASAKNKYVIDLDWALVKGTGFWKRLVAALKFFFLGGFFRALKTIYASYFRNVSVTIYDARAMEAKEGLSKAEFFEKYGFVIVESKSNMTAEDWEESNRDQQATVKEYGNRAQDDGAAYNKRMDDFRNADTPVKRIYAQEVKEIIQTVVPRAKEVMPPAKGIRRKVAGGGFFNGPAKVVHNDYGVDFDEVTARNPLFDFAKQRATYDEMEANEFMLVNFWRPIKPMSEPLRSLPLCFLDASTLSEDDMVCIDQKSLGIAMALKYNPNQKIFYYPDMTIDEVVVFKQFHSVRNDTEARMPVFHTAFPDPAADETTEGRVSFEYRVSLLA